MRLNKCPMHLSKEFLKILPKKKGILENFTQDEVIVTLMKISSKLINQNGKF